MCRVSLIASLLLTMVTVVACENKESKESTGSKSILPAGLVTTSLSGSPQTVIEAINDKKVGDEALVVGRIGGRPEPFAKDRAVFQLIDTSLASCDVKGDWCPVPWDYCCEPPEKISASSMTVQVVGDNGRPLPLGLDGKDGLEPLALLLVAGKVQKTGAGVFVLDAEKIMIEKGSPVSNNNSNQDQN